MDNQTIERVRKGLKDPGIGPETIALMVTGVCNLNCLYCRGSRPQNNNLVGEELTTEELFVLLEDACAFGVKEINLGGMNGEPFCKKGIMKVVHKIKQLRLFGSMTTNGSFLNAQLAKEFDDCGWDIMLLSLDAPQAHVQHILRPASGGSQYFDNIISFLDALQSRDSKLRVLINMVITRLNYKLLAQMVEFAKHYKNIESINILKLINMGLPTYDELNLGGNELKEFQSILLSLKESKKINYARNWGVDLSNRDGQGNPLDAGIDSQAKINKCFTSYYILSIDANGDILQCPQHQNSIQGLNIKKTPLSKLWKNELLQFRNNLVNYAPCFEGCCTILKEQNKLIYELLGQEKSG